MALALFQRFSSLLLSFIFLLLAKFFSCVASSEYPSRDSWAIPAGGPLFHEGYYHFCWKRAPPSAGHLRLHLFFFLKCGFSFPHRRRYRCISFFFQHCISSAARIIRTSSSSRFIPPSLPSIDALLSPLPPSYSLAKLPSKWELQMSCGKRGDFSLLFLVASSLGPPFSPPLSPLFFFFFVLLSTRVFGVAEKFYHSGSLFAPPSRLAGPRCAPSFVRCFFGVRLVGD